MRPEFTPQDPAFAARVTASFERQPAMSALGIGLRDLGPGWVELDIQRSPEFTQQHGFIHAGVLATALDSACGYAAFSLMAADAAVLTVEYKVNLLRPADQDRYLVRGWVVKPGRTVTVCLGEAVPDPGSPAVAVMTGTIMSVVGRGLTG